jgi:hypothetical protein
VRKLIALVFAVAVIGATLVSSALASNNGASGGASVNSIYNSAVGGTCIAAYYTPAGYVSHSYTTTNYYLGYPAYYCP